MAGNLTAMIAAIFSGSAVSTDPYFNLTTLLLSTTATNGQQNNTFQDSSTNNFTITRNPATGPNAPTQGTFSPFSQTGWGNFNPDSNNGIGVATNTALNMGTGDFTVEAWVNTAKLPTTNAFQTTSGGYQAVFGTGPNNAATGSQLYIGVTNLFFDISSDGSGPISVAHNMVAGQWYHVAITRSGTTFRAFINGTLVQTATSSASWADGYAYGIMRAEPIGGFSGAWWYGYVSNFRLTKGGALYTANFTPSVTPLTTTVSSGTVSLLTCQSNRFKDNSTNNFTITPNGSTSVQAFSPFNPTASWSAATYGGSGYFDGSGDYLALPTSNATLYPGSGAFTFECWIYPTGTLATLQSVFSYGGSAGNLRVFIQNGGLQIWNGATSFTGGNTALVKNNAWNHIVVQRDSSNYLTSYVNGTRDYYTVQTVNFNAGSLQIAADGGANLLTGYESGFSFIKGSATYSGATITVPTAPPTNITNTQLLLNFTNSGIYDATAKNVLETVGNAQVSTAQSKWPPTSMYFDGTGDYLLIPDNPSQRIGTGNFTVECWVYRNASGTYGLIGKGTGTTGWLLSLNSSNQVVFTYGSSTITSTGTISATTWTHIAVVRSGTGANLTKIYISGTNDGTGTVSTDFNQTNAMYVAADRTGGSNANAYVQDTRVTLYARYSANFTPPTAAFPVR